MKKNDIKVGDKFWVLSTFDMYQVIVKSIKKTIMCNKIYEGVTGKGREISGYAERHVIEDFYVTKKEALVKRLELLCEREKMLSWDIRKIEEEIKEEDNK